MAVEGQIQRYYTRQRDQHLEGQTVMQPNPDDQFQIKVSIFHKLMLYVAMLIFAAVGITTYFTVKTESEVLRDGLIQSGKRMAKQLASSTQSAFWSLNWIYVENLLRSPELYGSKEMVYAKIVKPNGEVYLANEKAYYGEILSNSLRFDQETLLKTYYFPARQEHGMLLIYPVSIGVERWYIVLGFSLSPIQEASVALVQRNIMWGLVILIPAVVLSFFLSKTISKPLIGLSTAAKIVADGNLNHTVKVKSKDEVGLLSHAFNRMVNSLNRAEQNLKISNERFLKVLDSIYADIYVADMESYEILFMNKNMRKAFGKNLVGQICWKAFRNETGPCEHCTNKDLLDGKGKPGSLKIWEGAIRLPETGISIMTGSSSGLMAAMFVYKLPPMSPSVNRLKKLCEKPTMNWKSGLMSARPSWQQPMKSSEMK